MRQVLVSLAILATLPGLAHAQYDLYWGNFHAHSTLSDGSGSATEAFTYARDIAGIDILALSEHTHMLSASEWTTLGNLADQFTEDGVFVALQSQEFGILNDFGHINIHGSEFKNPNASTNLPATYSFIQTVDGVGAFNHPNPSYGTWFDNLSYFPEYESSMHGMEVVNGLASNDYEDIWITALNNGWKLAPFGSQDNHEEDWGDRPNTNDGNRIYLTGVYATELTTDGVIDALRNRRFFAVEQRPKGDLVQLEFDIDGNVMGSEVTVTSTIELNASITSLNGITLCNRIDLYRDGVVIDSHVAVNTTLSHTFVDTGLEDGAEHYYFIRGRQTDGDLAWSAPIWVTVDDESSDIAENSATAPTAQLLPNSPNPFSPSTDIRFILPSHPRNDEYRVRLTIHESSGRLVRDMGERALGAGEHRWTWDGRDDVGQRVASGVYLYRLHGENLPSSAGRMIFLSD